MATVVILSDQTSTEHAEPDGTNTEPSDEDGTVGTEEFLSAGRRPELVVGFVAPLGTDLRAVIDSVASSLQQIQYQTHELKVTALLEDAFEEGLIKPAAPIDDSNEQRRIESLQDAGNEIRAAVGDDALALLCLTAIRALRSDQDSPEPSSAFLINQLKHPAEVHFLRSIFGDRFVLIGAGSQRAVRQEMLARRLAGSSTGFDFHEYEPAALELINRDEYEHQNTSGQNVRETFPLSDLFVDPEAEPVAGSVGRFVELLFGYQFHTPTIDEVGMRLATTMSLRSAAMGRQVGVALLRSDGTLLSVGANDVPRAGGGVYWPHNEPDHRDHVLGYDSTNEFQRRMISELLSVMQSENWLSKDLDGLSLDELIGRALNGEMLKGSRALSLVEFGRTLHAEMNALLDAARYGSAVQDSVLYSTTYPCHECTRHIIGAGVIRVVFIDPYPKSLADTLHGDAIRVGPRGAADSQAVSFEPFVGVAPRRFDDVFKMGERKDPLTGKVLDWQGANAEGVFEDRWGPVMARVVEPMKLQQFFETLGQAFPDPPAAAPPAAAPPSAEPSASAPPAAAPASADPVVPGP